MNNTIENRANNSIAISESDFSEKNMLFKIIVTRCGKDTL